MVADPVFSDRRVGVGGFTASVKCASPLALFGKGVGDAVELWLNWKVGSISIVPFGVNVVNSWKVDLR